MKVGYWNDMDFDTEEDYLGYLGSMRIAEEKQQLETALFKQMVEENQQAVETRMCPHCHEELTKTSDGLTCMVCYHVYGEAEGEE